MGRKEEIKRLCSKRNSYEERLDEIEQKIMIKKLEYGDIPSEYLYNLEEELKENIFRIENEIEGLLGRELNSGSFKELYERD